MTAGVLLSACGVDKPYNLNDVTGQMPDLSFQLTGESGRTRTAADYAGQVVVMFFGFTHCPDICPTTLARLTRMLDQLGPAAKEVEVLFVSVDPWRDTPEVLARYTDAFGPRVVGLTGEPAALRTLVERYYGSVSISKNPAENEHYNVGHTSSIYVFDGEGRLRLLGSGGEKVDAVTADVRRLVEAGQEPVGLWGS